jgi:hypothetical protein
MQPIGSLTARSGPAADAPIAQILGVRSIARSLDNRGRSAVYCCPTAPSAPLRP